ncbi:MAG: LptA/OstA family protein [Hyphomicrobiaceae bacterium]
MYEPADAAKTGGDTAKQQSADVASQSRLSKILARGGVIVTSRDSRAEGLTLSYDAKTEQANLQGNVVLTQAPDRRATAQSAHIDQKSDKILLAGQVVVTQAENIMRAERLDIDRKLGTARFASPPENGRGAGRISTLLHQKNDKQKRPAKAAKPQAEPQNDLASTFVGSGFRSSPDAPIEIEAATLDIYDRHHKAIYTGRVIAKQGNFIVNTELMTAHYTGETGLASSGKSGRDATPSSSKTPGPNLKRIEARKGVIVTGNEGQRAASEWANFDVKANTIVMGGKVEITQVAQALHPINSSRYDCRRRMRFVINLTTGRYFTEVEPGRQSTTGPQVSGAFSSSSSKPASTAAAPGAIPFCPKGAICKSNRPQLLIYPNQLEKSKAGKAAGAEAARTIKSRRQQTNAPAPEASSWSATTSTGQQR